MDNEPDDKVVDRIREKKTRIQKVQEVQARKSKERSEAIALTKAYYLAEQDNPVILDILTKAKNFAAYHTKMAQDGVGYRNTGHTLKNGAPEQELYFFTSEKRVSELDKAAGILELVDYIERQFKEAPKPKEESASDVEAGGDGDFVAEADESAADLT